MKKILFIEDEPALQKAFGDILRKEGYDMISALNGEIGLELANPSNGRKKPDLILLDLILPKVHGLEVLKELKSDPGTKDIPVIVLSNLEETEDINKAIELGVKTYLVKTQYRLEEVVEKVKKAII